MPWIPAIAISALIFVKRLSTPALWFLVAVALIASLGKTDQSWGVYHYYMNAKYFTGSSYTAAWYLGVYGAASSNNPAAGDTMASHAGWTEVTAYSEATRPVCTFGVPTTADPSVATNTASPAVFSINGTTVIGGAFLTTNNTKGGTTGTLFSAGDFAAPGDRSVVAGDTLTLTYTFSLDAA
jgi:hypothetical protein